MRHFRWEGKNISIILNLMWKLQEIGATWDRYKQVSGNDMKILLTILFFFTILTSYGQTTSSCETIHGFPQTLPQYTNNTTKGLMDYLIKELVPILSDCIKQDKEIITSMHIKLSINKTGKVIAVDFPRLQASESCKEKLRKKNVDNDGLDCWASGRQKCLLTILLAHKLSEMGRITCAKIGFAFRQ